MAPKPPREDEDVLVALLDDEPAAPQFDRVLLLELDERHGCGLFGLFGSQAGGRVAM